MTRTASPDLHAAIARAAIARGATDAERERIAAWCGREAARVDDLIDDLLLLIRASALLDAGLPD